MFRIASNQFGYLMFAAPSVGNGWTDRPEEAATYDHRDDRGVKLAYWRGIARFHGLDPNCVQIVEA